MDERFIKINLELFNDRNLNNTERIILSYIKGFPNGYYSSISRMAEVLGNSRKTISVVVSGLIKKGYVFKKDNTLFAGKNVTQVSNNVTQVSNNVTPDDASDSQTEERENFPIEGEKFPIDRYKTTHQMGKNVTQVSNFVTQTCNNVTLEDVSESQIEERENFPIERENFPIDCYKTTHPMGKNVTESVTKLPTYNKEKENDYIFNNYLCQKNEQNDFFEEELIFEMIDDDEEFDVTKDYIADKKETEKESESINNILSEQEDERVCEDKEKSFRPDLSELTDYCLKNNLSYKIYSFLMYYDEHGWTENGKAIDWKKKVREFKYC